MLLYKYCKCGNNSIDIIRKSQFYFCSPKYFNDPFDSKINLDMSSIEDNEILNHIRVQYPDMSPKDHIWEVCKTKERIKNNPNENIELQHKARLTLVNLLLWGKIILS